VSATATITAHHPGRLIVDSSLVKTTGQARRCRIAYELSTFM